MFTYTEPKDTKCEIDTPSNVSQYLYERLKHLKPRVVFDPCAGLGNLLEPWKQIYCCGVEINKERFQESRRRGFDIFGQAFELYEHHKVPPDLILCNPPWNRHWKGLNYSEIFLRKIVELWGKDIPIAFLVPMGFRLNQRTNSQRFQWMKTKGPQITSIISCPLDMYPDVKFHNEIILFNVKRVKPHYWIEL